ncbi:MAG: hypothetical protein ACI3VU_04515 [Faecousia sp.]
MKKTAKLLLCFLLILSLLLTAAACSKKEEKQNAAGYYILKTVSEDGEELDLETLGFSKDEAFLLLNEDGTAVLYLFDELTDLTWRNNQLRPVEGENTEPVSFTLEDKLLRFESDGTVLTFKLSKDDPPDLDALREKLAEPDGPVGCYILDSMTMEGTTVDAEQLSALGMSAYIEFYEDGTGIVDLMGDIEDFEWEDDKIYDDGETLTFTLEGDVLTVTDGEGVMVFHAGEKPETPTVIPTEPIEYPDELPEGRYVLIEASNNGTTISGDDLVATGLSDTYIEFRADGTGEIGIMGEIEEFTWEGTVMTDSIGDVLTYTYDGTEVSFEVEGTAMTFSKDAPAAKGELETYWDGDWYGWWMMENCTGYYADLEGYWWDLCAEIDIDESGAGTISLWDEDYTRDNLLGLVSIYIDTASGADAHGSLVSVSGSFEIGDIGEGDWNASPADAGYDDCLMFTGKVQDGEDSYEYTIVLRPWGTLWDDVEEDFLPYYYDDWYLPLIEENAEMPDYIITE